MFATWQPHICGHHVANIFHILATNKNSHLLLRRPTVAKSPPPIHTKKIVSVEVPAAQNSKASGPEIKINAIPMAFIKLFDF